MVPVPLLLVIVACTLFAGIVSALPQSVHEPNGELQWWEDHGSAASGKSQNCSLSDTKSFKFSRSTNGDDDDDGGSYIDSDSDSDSQQDEDNDGGNDDVDDVRHPQPTILVEDGAGGSFALKTVNGVWQGCPEHEPTRHLRRDGVAMTPTRVVNALDRFMSASDLMNSGTGQINLPGTGTIVLPVIGTDRRYLARVNPVNARVFGAYVVPKDTYVGVMTAAEEGVDYLQSTTGAYQISKGQCDCCLLSLSLFF